MTLDSLTRNFAATRTQVRFVLAGGVNTLFGLAIYPLLLWLVEPLHRRYMLGLVVAQALSLCVAFAVYKLTVFRTRSGALGEFARFLPFYLAVYAINWLALPLLVDAMRLDPVVAQFGFSIVAMIGGYAWHSRITFRPVRGHP